MISLKSQRFKSFSADRLSKSFTLLRTLFVSLFLVMGLLSTADAQITRLEVGDRVRVTAPFVDPMTRIKGTVSEMSGSVLVLSRKDSLIYVSDSLIQSLEISTGKKRVVGRGLLVGAVTGAMIFGAIAAINNNACGPEEGSCSSERSNGDAFVSGGTTGLLVGTVAGAITGFFIKIDNWERAPVRLAIGVAPTKTDVDQWSMKPNISFRIPLGD